MIDLTREKLMHIKDVAAFLKVDRKTVVSYFDNGLENGWIGRRRVTTLEAIQRYVQHDNQRCSKAKPQGISRERMAALEEIEARAAAGNVKGLRVV